MEEFIINSKSYFYTDLIMAFCALLTSIVGFFLRKRHRSLKYMYLYPLASFLQILSLYISWISVKIRNWDTLSNFIFLLIEFYLIYLFYLSTIESKTLKIIYKILPLVYLITIILFLIYNNFWCHSRNMNFLRNAPQRPFAMDGEL